LCTSQPTTRSNLRAYPKEFQVIPVIPPWATLFRARVRVRLNETKIIVLATGWRERKKIDEGGEKKEKKGETRRKLRTLQIA
jgi:hypothetical protein